MPEVLLPDTTNPGPWHHYPASGKLIDQNELPVLQFTAHAGKQAQALIIHAPLLMVQLQKLIEAAELASDLSEAYTPELEKQIAASRNLLNFLSV